MKCLAVLIDALNPVYLDYMPVLRRCSENGVTGRLREPLGFTPREAYFGGLTPNETGYTHMFRPSADGWFNPFSLARHFPKSHRAELDQIQSYLQPAFAGLYARSQAIPWRLLPHFAVSERFSPWDPRKGYSSIFDRLKQQGRRWAYVGWPFHQVPDRQLVDRGLQALAADNDFVFVHLSELDSLGHEHGPHSTAVMHAAQRMDGLLGELLDAAPGYSHLVFGDHGMVPVTRHIAVDLRGVPDDTLYFIDSTTVRVWGAAAGREAAREILNAQGGLREMEQTSLRRYAAEKVPNGLLYWAEPGCVLTPNFFGTRPVQGMHGYLPDVFDNESMFAIAGDGQAPRAVKPIDAMAIHAILQGLLGLADRPEFEAAPRTVFCRNPAGDAVVAPALRVVTTRVSERLPEVTGLYLCGGFGRGEGTVIDGKLINDLDLVFEAAAPIAPGRVRDVADLLKNELELPFVDLSGMLPEDVSQYAYDFRYGTQALIGSRTPIESRAHLASGAIPLAAFQRMVLNRIAGYLSSFCPPYNGMSGYRQTQVVKLGLGVAHWLLARRRAYHYSYHVCQQRLELLPPVLRPHLTACFEQKLHGRMLTNAGSEAILSGLRTWLAADEDPTGTLERSSWQAWKNARVYARLYRTFLSNHSVNPDDVAAWFQIIHPR